MIEAVAEAVSIPVIASGGEGNLEYVYEAVNSARHRRSWPLLSSTSAKYLYLKQSDI